MTSLMLFMVILLVLGNGFFVAAEFSLVAIRRSRVEQLVSEGRRSAIPVKRALDNLDLYLAATQLGITLTSLALGWIGEPALAHLIEPAFGWLPEKWAKAGAHGISIALAFMMITALHIVLGELAPKSLAIQRPESVALMVARPLEFFLTLFRPAIFILNWLGNAVLRIFGLKPAQEGHSVHSGQELAMLVESSTKEGTITKEEGRLIRGVFRLADQPVGAVMTPRPKLVWINLHSPFTDICKLIADSTFSRLPAGEGTIDNVVGVLEKKSLVTHGLPKSIEELKKHLKKPLFIPNTAPSLKAIDLLRNAKEDVAVVVNEFGSIEGLLTMQDILFSIKANIAFEVGENDRVRQPDGSILLNAAMPIDNVKEAFNLKGLAIDGSFHTLGGFILNHLGKVPRAGDQFDFEGHRFEVAEMLGTRILHVRVRPLTPISEVARSLSKTKAKPPLR